MEGIFLGEMPNRQSDPASGLDDPQHRAVLFPIGSRFAPSANYFLHKRGSGHGYGHSWNGGVASEMITADRLSLCEPGGAERAYVRPEFTFRCSESCRLVSQIRHSSP